MVAKNLGILGKPGNWHFRLKKLEKPCILSKITKKPVVLNIFYIVEVKLWFDTKNISCRKKLCHHSKSKVYFNKKHV